MTRDRYGLDNNRLGSPAKSDGSSQGQGGEGKKTLPEDRDDYIEKRPFRREQRQGPPDPSRASNAERYSYHKRPLE
jgi:hypothetical protein